MQLQENLLNMTDGGLSLLTYPNEPGWLKRETSRQAAIAIKPKDKPLRVKCLDMVRESVFGISPDRCARELGKSILSIRPRFAQLAEKGLITDSGRRDVTDSGKPSIIWIST